MCGPEGWIPPEGNRGDAGVRWEGDQGRTLRLETRAGELTATASLRASARRRRETDRRAAVYLDGEARGLKGPGVVAVMLETGRSSPGQGEAGRKPGGGPKGC